MVLDGVDLDVAAGQGLVILGGSGSGKSVTIKCILGLIEPDEGVIEIDGVDVLKLPRREREALGDRIGMLFQNGALFDSLPVWENVCFKLLAQGRITRAKARDRAAEVLAQVGLAATVGDLSPAELSGGMQKRVGLARAIAAQPDIIFFDEPTTGLDPIMGAVIDGLIVDCVQKLGATAVSITHDMASARRIGDHRGDDLPRPHRLDRAGREPGPQRQCDGGSIRQWPARRADPDGAPQVAAWTAAAASVLIPRQGRHPQRPEGTVQ